MKATGIKTLALVGVVALSCLGVRADEIKLEAVADRLDCLYASGATGVVSFTAKDASGALAKAGVVNVRVDNFGAAVITNVTADLAQGNPFRIAVSRTEPGFVRFTSGKFIYGLGFDVGKIRPGTPDPDDFDAFWKDAIAKYDREIPSAPETRIDEELSDAKWIVERVAFAAPGGRMVHGFVSKERAAKGRLPGRVAIAAAGYGNWSQNPRGSRKEGMVTLFLTVFPFEPDVNLGRRAEYDACDAAAKAKWGVSGYCHGGISESREAYFFYPVILANNRAIDWFAARPDVDAARIDYEGTSQGGGLGLAAMGLNRHFARGMVFVPALTDLLGSKVGGRQSGWPMLVEAQLPENRPAAERNAPYFCGVNFARRIRIPIRFCVGYADQTCSPNAVYSAYNMCPSADKAIVGGVGMGHGAFHDYYRLLNAWSKAARTPKGKYRFLAFNVWGDYFGNPVEERAADLVALVRKWNPDFAGFQEVTESFWRSPVCCSLTNGYAFVGRDIGFKGASAHTPLAYRRDRFELIDSGIILHCPELDSSKGAVWAVLRDKADGKKLVAFASHAWWRYDGIGDDWIRLRGSQLLCAKMDELAKKYDAAVIGGGDLNAPVTSESLKYIVAHGYVDAQETAEVSPKGFPTEHGDPKRSAEGVYVGRNGANGHNPVKEKFRRLDHVFYDPAKIVVRRFDLDLSSEACRVSDHHPIVADFDLR